MVIVGSFARTISEQTVHGERAAIIALPLVAVTDLEIVPTMHDLLQAWNDGIGITQTAGADRVSSMARQEGTQLLIDARFGSATDLQLHITIEANEILLHYSDDRRSRFRHFVTLLSDLGASWALHDLRLSRTSSSIMRMARGGAAHFSSASPIRTSLLLTQIAMALTSIATWTGNRQP